MSRIACIAPYRFLPPSSGGHQAIALLYKYLSRQTDMLAVGVPENDAAAASGYSIHPLLSSGVWRYFSIPSYRRISRTLKQEACTEIWIEHPYLGWMGRKTKKKAHLKFSVRSHNIEFQRFRDLGKWWWPILKRYEGWTYRQADRTFFITPEDRNTAIDTWGLDPACCHYLPFGTELTQHPANRADSRLFLCNTHGIDPGDRIFLFNGMFNYPPNRKAFDKVIETFVPGLEQTLGNKYKLIICGKNIPKVPQEISSNIIVAGFVSNLSLYLKGADILINPVRSGGGVNTKIIEAIAHGTTVVSTETGARGIDQAICDGKLAVAADGNWDEFLTLMLTSNPEIPTPSPFYDHYYWGNIIDRIPV